eukprot:364282-Chlamydomonas_euryale.AAC.14
MQQHVDMHGGVPAWRPGCAHGVHALSQEVHLMFSPRLLHFPLLSPAEGPQPWPPPLLHPTLAPGGGAGMRLGT